MRDRLLGLQQSGSYHLCKKEVEGRWRKEEGRESEEEVGKGRKRGERREGREGEGREEEWRGGRRRERGESLEGMKE